MVQPGSQSELHCAAHPLLLTPCRSLLDSSHPANWPLGAAVTPRSASYHAPVPGSVDDFRADKFNADRFPGSGAPSYYDLSVVFCLPYQCRSALAVIAPSTAPFPIGQSSLVDGHPVSDIPGGETDGMAAWGSGTVPFSRQLLKIALSEVLPHSISELSAEPNTLKGYTFDSCLE
jgi:hypothetical protein